MDLFPLTFIYIQILITQRPTCKIESKQKSLYIEIMYRLYIIYIRFETKRVQGSLCNNLKTETLLSWTPMASAQSACLEMKSLSSSVKLRFCRLHSPGKQRTQGQRKTTQSSGLVYSCVGKKTGRRKWGLTVSWSTIGWWQIQCDWAELGDDPYSMQNSLSSWSVPTSP